MKNFLITTSILLVLVVGGSLLASCAAESFTNTITVQPPGGSSTVITPTFTTTPPEIPHVYFIDDPDNPYIAGLISESGGAICFECHGTPPQHEIWVSDPNVCSECHIVSDNPILVPQ